MDLLREMDGKDGIEVGKLKKCQKLKFAKNSEHYPLVKTSRRMTEEGARKKESENLERYRRSHTPL